MQYGYLKMVLPFLTVIATPFICSMADRHRSHRSYFTLSLIFTTISFCFYALLPLLENDTNRSKPSEQFKFNETIVIPADYLNSSMEAPKLENLLDESTGLLVGPWVFYCLTSLILDLALAINTCLADSFSVLQAEELGSSFGRIIVWGTFGWASAAIALGVLNQWKGLPLLMPGILFSVCLLTTDVFVITFWRKNSDFKLDLIPAEAASTLTGSSSPSHRDPSDYLPLNESARVNLGSEVDKNSNSEWRRTTSPVDLINESRATQLNRDLPLRSASIRTINSELDQGFQDEPFPNVVDDSSSSRSSGSTTKTADLIPQPVTVIGTEVPLNAVKINQQQLKIQKTSLKSSKTIDNQKSSTKTTGDFGSNDSDDSRSIQFASFRMQLLLLGMILKRRKSLIRYLVLFILAGFFMSMHWNYFFLYLEEIYYDEFALISALSMVGQSILGELPFFILSRKVIDYFGRSYTLSISLISIGIRFLLYGYMLPNYSMYLIVFADCLQGPNYGLFYVVMTEVGLEYSFCDESTINELAARGDIDRDNKRQVDAVRLSLRSTVQSMAYACYEGIGVGFGSLAGGWLKHSYGFKVLWTSTAIASISAGLINAMIELALNDRRLDNSSSGRRDFMEARRNGTLKKLAPPRLMQSVVAASKQEHQPGS